MFAERTTHGEAPRTTRAQLRHAFGLMAVLVLIAPATEASAYCRMTTSTMAPTPAMPCVTDGIPLAWRRRCTEIAFYNAPDTLTLEQVRTIFASSFAQWEGVDCGGATTGVAVTQLDTPSLCNIAQYNRDNPNVNTMVFKSGAAWAQLDYDANAYALTTVWHNVSTGEIYDADMEINLGRGPYVDCDVTACTGRMVDLANVVTHEAGHYFGMGHTTTLGATMFPAAPPGEIDKRTLEEDDRAGLCAAYPAGALSSTCDPTPRGGLSLECGNGSSGGGKSCGCRVPAREGAQADGHAMLAGVGGLLGLLAVVVRRGTRRGRKRV